MTEEKITIKGVTYRIDWSPAHLRCAGAIRSGVCQCSHQSGRPKKYPGKLVPRIRRSRAAATAEGQLALRCDRNDGPTGGAGMNEEVIQIGGLTYRIDYSHRLGWVVTVGTFVKYFSPDHDDCVRWIHRHAEERRKNENERTEH